MGSFRYYLRAYAALVRASWLNALELRAQILLSMLGIVFPLVMMTVWLTVAAQIGTINGWKGSDFISYYVAATIVNYCTSNQITAQWIHDIGSGELSSKLLKPITYFQQVFCYSVGEKMFIVLFAAPLLALLIFFMQSTQHIAGLGALVLFTVAVGLGFTLNLLMATAFGLAAFWSPQTGNLYGIWVGIGYLLSGWVAPLSMLPQGLDNIATLLPFQGLLGFPISILTGRSTARSVIEGIVVDMLWIGTFFFLDQVLWRLGIRRYEAVGA